MRRLTEVDPGHGSELDPIRCPLLDDVVPGGDVARPEPIGPVWDRPPYVES